MSSNSPDSPAPKGGGLWARLFGVQPARPQEKVEKKEELAAEWIDVPTVPPPLGEPTSQLDADLEPQPEPAELAVTVTQAPPVEEVVPAEPAATERTPESTETEESAPPAPPQLCPSCQTPHTGSQPFCEDCGWMFGPNDPARLNGPPAPAAGPAAAANNPAGNRVKDRYEIGELMSERPGVSRHRGMDHGGGQPVPVIILRAAVSEMAPAVDEDLPAAPVEEPAEDEFLPTFEEPTPAGLPVALPGPGWPSVAWEKELLEKANHLALPGIRDYFVEGSHEYLVEEVPEGRPLWDAWDEPDADARVRYGWLKQVAEGLQAVHRAGAIFESLRPDVIRVTASGQAVLADLSDLLPLPVPPGTPIRATLYTAPEVVLTPQQADARADLYGFGAMIYALEYLHHALEEKDFEHQFSPHLITDRYPDVHPGFFRLVCKTFCRDVNTRFPTDEAAKEDATGFTELIRTLDVCARSFDKVRFDIAAWTTTGMVRSGNEDAFAVMHAVESRQDELTEYAMVLLCDGMGGYEAGEVAAALAIASMRKYLLQQPIFAALAGNEAPDAEAFDVAGCQKVLEAALRHANKEVYTAARTPGKGRRGMGCTAECVYIDQAHVVVGHVGDSRVYHLQSGRLVQLTRDQTLVNRLVELGQLTPEEAENHPRKNELQQAIGGQPDVVPGTYSGRLRRGDWVLVCSDGLSNHIPPVDLEKMMLREAAGSAEEAARRLMNLANLRGATDNATIVVVRAM
jgi:serine/threonine protein phosphatase PrpC